MDIKTNVEDIMLRIARAAQAAGRAPGEISLVAATKLNDKESIQKAIQAGIGICGENRVQEMLEKAQQNAYEGAKLHFIGHLQKNKVRQVVGLCSLIESVDSLELLEAIDARAKKLGIIQEVLLEINIAQEASKSGFIKDDINHILDLVSVFGGIRVKGLMAIPPISRIAGANRPYFAQMYKLLVDNSSKKYDNVSMDFLSMGMSGDFEDAIAEGSNMVRVGSAIFGARNYTKN